MKQKNSSYLEELVVNCFAHIEGSKSIYINNCKPEEYSIFTFYSIKLKSSVENYMYTKWKFGSEIQITGHQISISLANRLITFFSHLGTRT